MIYDTSENEIESPNFQSIAQPQPWPSHGQKRRLKSRHQRYLTKDISEKMQQLSETIKQSIHNESEETSLEQPSKLRSAQQSQRTFFELSGKEQQQHIRESIRQYERGARDPGNLRALRPNSKSQRAASDSSNDKDSEHLLPPSQLARTVPISKIYTGKPYSVGKIGGHTKSSSTNLSVNYNARCATRLRTTKIVPVLHQQSVLQLNPKIIPSFQYQPDNYPLLLEVHRKHHLMESLRSQRGEVAHFAPARAEKVLIQDDQNPCTEESTNSAAHMSTESGEPTRKL